MRLWTVTLGAILALTACHPGEIPAVECGDGVVDVTEPCDDANLVDGDGCSSTCEVEEAPAPECFPILESLETRELSTHVTPDGRVVFAGKVQTAGEWGAWVGAVDIEGTLLWSLDFGPSEDGYAALPRPRGDGFMFIHADVDKDLVTIDGEGNIVDTVTLDSGSVEFNDLLEVDAGLLFAGQENGETAWFGRLGNGGALETLATIDYAGDWDSLGSLRRHGDRIGTLAVVGLDSDGDPENGSWDTLSTLLIEYNAQGVEQRRTVLSSGEEGVSWIGYHLDVFADGTWIVVGAKGGSIFATVGWAVAVRDGEVIRTFESPGTLDVAPAGQHAGFYTGVAGQDVVLAGHINTTLGTQPWAVRIDGTTGGLDAEFVGAMAPVPNTRAVYSDAGMTLDGRVWLVGSTVSMDIEQESAVQWLCSTSL